MTDTIQHDSQFKTRRFWNWFPLGVTYALLYMGRYNLTVAKNSLGSLMTKEDFGLIFGAGAVVYAFSFLINGPLVDRIGGKKGILIAALGAGIMNLVMGLYLMFALGSPDPAAMPLKWTYVVMYSINMYFQSYGAASIVKVNSSWFHVRERGTFSGIFGIMISSGIFLAFDISQRIIDSALVKRQGYNGGDALWWVFFAPAALLGIFFLIETFLLKDRPSQAGLKDFDTGDESSGEDLEEKVHPLAMYRRILTHPVLLTIIGIEFCTGVLRNGVMHWFSIYSNEQIAELAKSGGDVYAWQTMKDNWGLMLMIAGIIGGNVAGYVSDKFFQSRRAPSAAFLYGLLLLCTIAMIFSLNNGWALGIIVFAISIGVIGTHGLLSGTATMDFGGRKGAATAVGVIDGFVYLGTGFQSLCLGYITTKDWFFWPIFLIPFGVIGLAMLTRIWNAKPKGSGGH